MKVSFSFVCKRLYLQEHKKVIERGVPEDAMPGIIGIKVALNGRKIKFISLLIVLLGAITTTAIVRDGK